MGRKDSDYLLNLQEEIEKSTFFNQMFGYVGRYGYLCVSNSLCLILICKLISKPPPVKCRLAFFVHFEEFDEKFWWCRKKDLYLHP